MTLDNHQGVYAIGFDNYIKIGKARCVVMRMNDLQTGCPAPLIGIGFIPTTDLSYIEKSVHCWLHSFHIRGEWFKADRLIIEFFRTNPWPNKIDGSCVACRSKSDFFSRDGCRF